MKTKRIFIPGEEWLYYKIYCGVRTSDLIFTDALYPLIQSMMAQGWIDQWFFIRYNDPDYHIRIRFHYKDPNVQAQVMVAVQKALQGYVDEDIIYRVQLDTYIRELERYGNENTITSEVLFHKESDMLLKAISMVEDENLFALFIIKSIDRLLEDFGYDLETKLDFATRNRHGYWMEFKGNKHLTKQLNQKYSGMKSQLFSFMNERIEEYAPLDQLLDQKTVSTQELVQSIQNYLSGDTAILGKDDLLASYVHMLVNRAFRSQQRFYELVCYDFLLKHYQRMRHHPKSKK